MHFQYKLGKRRCENIKDYFLGLAPFFKDLEFGRFQVAFLVNVQAGDCAFVSGMCT